jgi:uncharacterized membrane protein
MKPLPFKPHLGRIFLTGLLTLIPAVATIYLMVWLFGAIDRMFGKPLRWLMPDETYLAGTGILVALALVFAVGKEGPAMRVVTLTLPGTKWRLLGFVAREDFTDLPPGVGGAGEVAVYLPMSYQVGGYTVIVPRDSVSPVEMSREEAMKFILTAGLKSAAGPSTRREAAPAPARTRPS